MKYEAFHEHVKDALANLYDFVYLRGHPLLDIMVPSGSLGIMARVHALRHLILQAVESLAPDDHVPRSAREWRPYLALRYSYVDHLEAQDVEARLALGERQTMRERLRGIEAVAQILWERQATQPAVAQPVATQANESSTPVEHELANLGVEPEVLSPAELIDSAIASVQPLALQAGVALRLAQPYDGLAVADGTLLRQAMIAALQLGIQGASQGAVEIGTHISDPELRIELTWVGAREAAPGPAWPLVESLMAAQEGACRLECSGAQVTLVMTIPQHARERVLVIDDNASALQLIERFLSMERYQVFTACGGEEGLGMATSELPDLVLVDVMMRGMDGWEVLLKLKALPATRRIPVLVCSVLPERELALSLGATDLVQKPLRRLELIEAVKGCLAASRSLA
jgi:CheY-like chemotaxis protein